MQELAEKRLIVVDASGQRLGRMASKIAKLLLSGFEVSVVNAEKAVITGTKSAVLPRYLKLLRRRQFSSHKVVKVWYPRRPERIVWLTIARMLPRKTPRGRAAEKRLKVYVGVPQNLEKAEKISFPEAALGEARSRSGRLIRYITVKELSKELSGGRIKLD